MKMSKGFGVKQGFQFDCEGGLCVCHHVTLTLNPKAGLACTTLEPCEHQTNLGISQRNNSVLGVWFGGCVVALGLPKAASCKAGKGFRLEFVFEPLSPQNPRQEVLSNYWLAL